MLNRATTQRIVPLLPSRATELRREPYTRSQLLSAVAQLARLDCTPLELPDLTAEVTNNLTRVMGGSVALSAMDAMAMNTVAVTLRQLQAHSVASAPISAFIRDLQLPLFKIVAIDPAMAVTRDHPAWDLLERMFEAAVGWDSSEDMSGDAVYASVRSAVRQVVMAPSDDLSIVLEAVASMDVALAEQRQQQASDMQRIAAARSAVHELLASKLATLSAAPCVMEFLRNPWRQVLCHIAEFDGTTTPAWQAAADVVEQLLWSISPKSDDVSRKRLVAMVPPLLASIEEGLMLVMFPHAAKDAFFAELEQLHLRALRGVGVPAQDSTAASRAVFARFGTTIHIEEVTLDSAYAEVMPSAPRQRDEKKSGGYKREQMPVGTWIEWRGENAAAWRGRLAWSDGFFREATFVTRNGGIAASVAYDDLADALRSGRALVLDGGAIVSQVLSTKSD